MNAYKILKYASISTIEKRFKTLKLIRLCHFIYSCFKIDLLPINVHIYHSLYKKGLLTNVIGYLIYATCLVYACKYKHRHYVKYKSLPSVYGNTYFKRWNNIKFFSSKQILINNQLHAYVYKFSTSNYGCRRINFRLRLVYHWIES